MQRVGFFSYLDEDGNPFMGKIIGHAVLLVVGIIVLFGTVGTIGAGERGVKTRFNAVVGTIEPGIYLKMPWPIEKVTVMNIQTRTVTYEREDPLYSASKDLQDVKIATVLNYRLDPTKVQVIYQQYGTLDDYEARIIRPAVRDTVKAVASQFTAEELVTKRPEFTDEVTVVLNERLQGNNYVSIERVNITNFEFSQSFSAAIEAKVTAVQQAEAEKNRLEKVKFEAQQKIETAKAEAESIRIQAQAITQQGGKDYVQLKAIERWDGKLPTQFVPNAAVPFLNLK